MARQLRLTCLALVLAVGIGAASELWGEEWGGIAPGITTMDAVRGRYGAPSREARQKEEGYDTVRWIYEGARAPVGMKRLTVEFGMLTAEGFRPNLVRFFVLEPKPRIFSQAMVLQGWGTPDMVGDEGGRTVFFYKAGLIVYLDPEREESLSMVFSIPQPGPGAPPK